MIQISESEVKSAKDCGAVTCILLGLIQFGEFKVKRKLSQRKMGLRSVLHGALFMKMSILCGFSFCLFVVFASSEPRDFRLKQYAQQVGMKRLSREWMPMPRRILLGPGSHPPRCMTKCGNCSPCEPVHVTVPPGSDVIMEYYPEAWRCKCRNHLYMP